MHAGIHAWRLTYLTGIVVSAPFLRWPCTDGLLNTALHNASVDEASNLDKTRNKLFGAFLRISASISFVSAAVLRLPDTGRAGRRQQTACLSPFLRVASRCFTFILTSSYVIKSAFRVRLFPQPFFASLALAGSLGETGRSVNTATNGVNKHCEKGEHRVRAFLRLCFACPAGAICLGYTRQSR
jgi:hypothetical protein